MARGDLRAEGLHPLALAQLQAWEAIAGGWPVWLRRTDSGAHLSCAICGMTVMPADDNQHPYSLNVRLILAQLVFHLRNVHRDIEGEVYKNAGTYISGQDTTPSDGIGIAGPNSGRGAYPN